MQTRVRKLPFQVPYWIEEHGESGAKSLFGHTDGWMRFCYLQLHNAVRSQFLQLPSLQTDPIEELLIPGDLGKPLLTLYGALAVDSPKPERLWEYWQKDITSMDEEDWEDCLEQGPKLQR